MTQPSQEYKTYAQKMRRADKEALYSVGALAIIIVAWIIGGIGLSGLDIEVASTPIWIIGGTVGTWLVSVIIAVVFAKRVFANFSLEDDENEATGQDTPTAIEPDGRLAAENVSEANKVGDVL